VKKMGNQKKKQCSEVAYIRGLCETVTVEDFKQIVQVAKEAALKGDAQARQFLAAFLCGMPGGTAPMLSLLDRIDEDSAFMEKLWGGRP
jgi:hypothetical protein